MRNPLGSTGFVICDDEQGRPQFVGTCFAYREYGFLLTTAHNVKDIDPERLSVSIYLDQVERGLDVEVIGIHPTADLAVLRIDDPFPDLRIFDYFQGVADDYDAGELVSAFGYLSQTTAVGEKPVPRFFRGNIQRLFQYDSLLGYKYIAIELSFGSPEGLSGGPVALDRKPSRVVGIMAENYRADTYVHSIEEVVTGEKVSRHTQHDFINYGIAVRLAEFQEWIDARCRPKAAIKPRRRR